MIYGKWGKLVEIIFEQQVRNESIYWQLIFEKCAALINRQLSLLTVLVFKLVEIIQNIGLLTECMIKANKVNKGNKANKANKANRVNKSENNRKEL